jgi:hypothetical protein
VTLNQDHIDTINTALEADSEYWSHFMTDCTLDERGAQVRKIAEARAALDALPASWKRLCEVIHKADAWRSTLDLPQQDLGCAEFNEAFELYDIARDSIANLIAVPERSDP